MEPLPAYLARQLRVIEWECELTEIEKALTASLLTGGGALAGGERNDRPFARRWKALDRAMMTHAAKMQETIVEQFSKIGEHVTRNLPKFRRAAGATKKKSGVSFDALFDEDEWQTQIMEALGPELGALTTEIIREALADARAPQSRIQSVFDEIVKKAIDDSSDKIRQSLDTVKEDIRGILRDNAEMNAGELETKIRDKYADYPTAATIARTTAGVATTSGQLSTWNTLGIKEYRWLSVYDADVRDAHADANGQVSGTKAAAGLFRVGGETLTGPRMGQAAGNNINCRCYLLPAQRAA